MSEEKAAEAKEKKTGVGDIAMAAIRAGKTNEAALEDVRAQFPDKKTSLASINWYRNKLRADGENVPTARELKKAAKDAAGETGANKSGDGF